MHLKQTKRNGRTYLSVVQSYRDGGRTRTRTIESLGYVDELAARYDDPIAHFRSYVDQLNAERFGYSLEDLAAARDQLDVFEYALEDVMPERAKYN